MLLGFCVGLPAGGSLVNVDFQGGGSPVVVGAGVLGGGPVWNVASGSGVEVPLLTAAGLASGLVVWSDGFTGTRTEGDTLYGDYLVGDFEVRGLVANEVYEVVLYNAANIQPFHSFAGPWQPTGVSANPPPFCAYADPALPGREGCDYLRGFATSDSAGVIAVSSGFGAVAGLQIGLPASVNPEPSGILLQAIAFGFLLSRRRR